MQVSIIMGIYNCSDTLEHSIQSILSQSFESWELIMCDDGSTDNTFSIAESYMKKFPDRIRLIKNDCNKGLNFTLNRCIDIAKGQYIARQDGDDMSLPNRLELEVQALASNPELAIVSTGMAMFDDTGTWGSLIRIPFPQKQDFIHGTPFAHAPCLVRAEALRAVGGYSDHPRLLRVEDYHLWYKMYLAGYRGMNLQEALYLCRDDRSARKRRKFKYRINESYVRWLIFKGFRLPVFQLPLVIKPILVGLVPPVLYQHIHKAQMSKND